MALRHDVDHVSPDRIGILADVLNLHFQLPPEFVILLHLVAVPPEVEDAGLLRLLVPLIEVVRLKVTGDTGKSLCGGSLLQQ